MISPPSCSASKSATADFPEAVGPTTKMERPVCTDCLQPRRRRGGPASQNPKQDQSRGQNSDAHHLCRGEEAAMNVVSRVIAPEIFHEGASERVAEQVNS